MVEGMADTETTKCDHPADERFTSRCFTIGGHPAGEVRELCAGCGWDFGPAEPVSSATARNERLRDSIDDEAYSALLALAADAA